MTVVRNMKALLGERKSRSSGDSGDWKADALHFAKATMQEVYPRIHKRNAETMKEIDAALEKAADLFEVAEDDKINEAMLLLKRQRKEVEEQQARLLILLSRLGEASEAAAIKYGI